MHCQSNDQAVPDTISSDKLLIIDTKLSSLSQAVEALQSLLDKLAVPPSANIQANVPPSMPADVNTSIPSQSPQGESPVSLDGFMFGEDGTEMETEEDLN